MGRMHAWSQKKRQRNKNLIFYNKKAIENFKTEKSRIIRMKLRGTEVKT